jgi:hypothetical protein
VENPIGSMLHSNKVMKIMSFWDVMPCNLGRAGRAVESESEWWSQSWSQKEFLGGVRVGKNVPTPTPASV